MELVDDLCEGLARRRQAGRSSRMLAVQQVIGAGDSLDAALEGVLRSLERAGFGDAIRSWRGTGPCLRVMPARLHAALGRAEVARLAGRAGLTEDEFVAELSEQLPALVAALPPSRPARWPAG